MEVLGLVRRCPDRERFVKEPHKYVKVKVKQSMYMFSQDLIIPGVEAPRFQDNRHLKVVRLPALHTGLL
jgi:hypothetical protein